MKKVNYIVKPDSKVQESYCFSFPGNTIVVDDTKPTPTPIPIPVSPCSSNTCYDCYFI